MIGGLALELSLPETWRISPTVGTPDFARWRLELGELPVPGSTLAAELASLDYQVARGVDDGRVWLVGLPPPGPARHITATGWLRRVPAGGLDLADIAANANRVAPPTKTSPLAGASVAAPIDVLSQDVRLIEAASVCQLLIYQLLARSAEDSDAHLVERLAALVHLRDLDTAVQLELTTADMSAFADLLTFGERLLSSITASLVGAQ